MSGVAVVLAAGSGSRSGSTTNKVYHPIQGMPLLWYSLQAFQASPGIDHVVLVVREGDQATAELVAHDFTKLHSIVAGSDDRHGSEVAGLRVVRDMARRPDLVAIHDGARPFPTADLVTALLDAAAQHGGAVPGVRFDGPVLRRDGESIRRVTAPLARMQTPQVFRTEPLLAAYAAARAFRGVDTAETMERFGEVAIAVVPGDPRNLKVTFVEDFAAAEMLVAHWSPDGWLTA